MEIKKYRLCFDRNDLELIIEPYTQGFYAPCTDEVKQFNSCIFTCTDRSKLREKAKEIKEVWLTKAKTEVDLIEQLKVKNKY